MTFKTLYILYNADATFLGKLKYGYRKITCDKDGDPACAACDITHGGLSLNESKAWVDVKREIESSAQLKIVQWHRDEVSPELKQFLQQSGTRYPAVLVGDAANNFHLVMDGSELASFKGDPEEFRRALANKAML